MRQISIAIPSYNRANLLFDSFSKVMENENVSEIVIVDDASNEDIYEVVKETAEPFQKIKLYRNQTNDLSIRIFL